MDVALESSSLLSGCGDGTGGRDAHVSRQKKKKMEAVHHSLSLTSFLRQNVGFFGDRLFYLRPDGSLYILQWLSLTGVQ